MRIAWIAVIATIAVSTSCRNSPRRILKPELGAFYKAYGLQGSFALFDPQEEELYLYHPEWYDSTFTPASTFKICNSLIGLETGVIPSADYVIAWDSVARNPKWDRDHNLKSAFSNSVVWYYQELARRVGTQKMQKWLDAAEYGNRNMGGGIDKFWLTGDLRISPAQQINFLQRLHDNQLPFSKRNIGIVKDIMLRDTIRGMRVYGKTGWGDLPAESIGWYVGYAEGNGKVYYFANLVRCPAEVTKTAEGMARFVPSRQAIVADIFNKLGLF